MFDRISGAKNIAKKTFTGAINKMRLNPKIDLNPIQDGGGQKGPPTSFPPVTCTIVGISPQNFLNFSFNPFDRLV